MHGTLDAISSTPHMHTQLTIHWVKEQMNYWISDWVLECCRRFQIGKFAIIKHMAPSRAEPSYAFVQTSTICWREGPEKLEWKFCGPSWGTSSFSIVNKLKCMHVRFKAGAEIWKLALVCSLQITRAWLFLEYLPHYAPGELSYCLDPAERKLYRFVIRLLKRKIQRAPHWCLGWSLVSEGMWLLSKI